MSFQSSFTFPLILFLFLQISLAMQLRDFKALGKLLREKLGETETSKVLNRAVYLFSIGGNDYFSLFSENPNASESHQRQYVEMVIGNLTSVLKVRT